MIKERFIAIWNNEGLSGRSLEELTGIDRYKWGNVRAGKQRITEDMIESVAENFPHYAYWLISGQTLPNAGQISPCTKDTEGEYKTDQNDQSCGG